MSAEQRQFTQAAHPGIRMRREYYSTETQPNAGWWSRRRHAVKVDLWTMVNHFDRPKSGQWQQSMFPPRGCIGWRMATTTGRVRSGC